MFEAFGDYAEGESLHARNGFITVRSVAHYASQVGYFGYPPAITFALKLYRESHPGTVTSGPSV